MVARPVVLPDSPPPRIHGGFNEFQRCKRGAAKVDRLRAASLALGHLVERGFGLGDLVERGDVARGVECGLDQIAPHPHQFAQQRQVVDLLRQFATGEQALSIGGQLREIGRTAQLLEPFVAVEIGFERNRRRHRVAICQRQNAGVDALVDRFEEMIG